jgi:hypothetical protein
MLLPYARALADRLALAAAFMVLTISCSSSAEFPAATIPDNFGVNTGVTTMRLDEEDLLKMRKAGIRYVRFDLFWHEIERAKGVYIWGPFDRVIMSLKRHDLKPILILDYGNKLYQPEGGGIRTEEARQGFANFAAAAVARYNSRIPGIIWEVWNEPNSNNFWEPKRNADEFVALIKAAVPAMRKADPTATIVSGGILELFWSVTQAYLERCFELGLLKEVDGLGVHLYGGDRNYYPERIIGELADLRKRMAAHGAAPDYPILNTEFGASLKEFAKAKGLTWEKQQHMRAEIHVRMHLLTVIEKLRMNVWYEWRWRENLSGNAILNSDGSPRAIYTAIETLNDRFAGYTFERRIEQPGKDDYVLVFAKDGRRKIAAWTTGDPRTVAMEVASSAVSFDTTGMLGESGSVEVRNGRFSANLTTSPIYIDIGTAALAR